MIPNFPYFTIRLLCCVALVGIHEGATGLVATTAQTLPTEANWQTATRLTWETYKSRYIDCGADCGGNSGLVYDPSADYQAVSEGVGYGMLMAVMMDDQATFDRIYDAALRLMANENGLLDWRIDRQGNKTGFGSATDAELDIAAALIFAASRVEAGTWQARTGITYAQEALIFLDAIYTFEVAEGRYLIPGDQFGGGGQAIINLSYFAPAWFRLYNAFEGSDRWSTLIEQGYVSLYATAGAAHGLAPDWSTATGEPAYAYCDANGRPRENCRYEMYYDAIRVPWRIGLDCLWYDEPLACEWSQRSLAFLKRLPPDQQARLYDMAGNPIVDYQDSAMLGMWIVSALAGGDALFLDRLERQLLSGRGDVLENGYWGGSPEFYYNQSLAWFGAALLSGDFRNLTWDQ